MNEPRWRAFAVNWFGSHLVSLPFNSEIGPAQLPFICDFFMECVFVG